MYSKPSHAIRIAAVTLAIVSTGFSAQAGELSSNQSVDSDDGSCFVFTSEVPVCNDDGPIEVDAIGADGAISWSYSGPVPEGGTLVQKIAHGDTPGSNEYALVFEHPQVACEFVGLSGTPRQIGRQLVAMAGELGWTPDSPRLRRLAVASSATDPAKSTEEPGLPAPAIDFPIDIVVSEGEKTQIPGTNPPQYECLPTTNPVSCWEMHIVFG